MADRVLKALPGDRYVTQGISNSGGSRFAAVQANSEEFTYKIDFTRWLDGSTITGNTVTPSSATVSTVATVSYLTLTVSAVSGSGQADITIVASDGRSKQVILALIEGRASVVPAYIVSPESESSTEGYNNTDSNLTATNVQEAIDELAATAGGILSEFAFTFDGGGLVVPIPTQIDFPVPFGCVINSVVMLADQVSNTTVDVWAAPYASFPPTVANTIVGSSKPTLSADDQSEDTTLTSWTTTVAAGTVIRVNLDTNSAAKRLGLFLKVTR